MRFGYAGLWLALAMFQAQASERWLFDNRVAVTDPAADAVYHHLDGAGRKHIAVSRESVAVVWEDNQSGAAQVYVTLKSLTEETFPVALLASSGSEAYEPAIAATSDSRFVLAFEQDASAYARILTAQGLAEPLRLSHWTVVDTQGVETRVALVDPQFNLGLDDGLFEFDEKMFDRPDQQ